jgi:hypothetical protein
MAATLTVLQLLDMFDEDGRYGSGVDKVIGVDAAGGGLVELS